MADAHRSGDRLADQLPGATGHQLPDRGQTAELHSQAGRRRAWCQGKQSDAHWSLRAWVTSTSGTCAAYIIWGVRHLHPPKNLSQLRDWVLETQVRIVSSLRAQVPHPRRIATLLDGCYANLQGCMSVYLQLVARPQIVAQVGATSALLAHPVARLGEPVARSGQTHPSKKRDVPCAHRSRPPEPQSAIWQPVSGKRT